MPRDISATMKLFMVDVYSIHNDYLICSHGPFSEKKAQRVREQIARMEPTYYGAIRRAREEERER